MLWLKQRWERSNVAKANVIKLRKASATKSKEDYFPVRYHIDSSNIPGRDIDVPSGMYQTGLVTKANRIMTVLASWR